MDGDGAVVGRFEDKTGMERGVEGRLEGRSGTERGVEGRLQVCGRWHG